MRAMSVACRTCILAVWAPEVAHSDLHQNVRVFTMEDTAYIAILKQQSRALYVPIKSALPVTSEYLIFYPQRTVHTILRCSDIF